MQISGFDAHSEEGNRRRKDDDEIRHVNNFPFSPQCDFASFFFLFLFFLDRAAISLGINLVRKFEGNKRARPWTLTPTATFLHPALALATADTPRSKRGRPTPLRTGSLSLSLDDLCGDKSELPVGSVWNLDAVEAILTKARAKGQTFDKDFYASPWPRK